MAYACKVCSAELVRDVPYCGPLCRADGERTELLELERRKVRSLERIAELLTGMVMESGELCVTTIGSVEVELTK